METRDAATRHSLGLMDVAWICYPSSRHFNLAISVFYINSGVEFLPNSQNSRKRMNVLDGKLMMSTLCYAFVRTKVEFHCGRYLTNPAPLQRYGGSPAARRLAAS